MNDKEMDDFLKKELKPSFAPPSDCNLKIIEKAKEIELMKNEVNNSTEKRSTKKRFFKGPVAAALLIALLVVSSVGAVAAVKYYNHLKADEVFSWKEIEPGVWMQFGMGEELEPAFKSEKAIKPEETKIVTAKDGTRYEVTLVGLVSGEFHTTHDITNGPVADSTETVIAVAREDGTPINDDLSDYPGVFIAMVISGYDPADYYNINGASIGLNIDGVLYYKLDSKNIEYFSDHTVYLTVSEQDKYGWQFNPEAYSYDEESGTLSRVSDYEGINALFELPLNPDTADSEKAAAIIKELEE